jgi:predicted aspartyl protease
MIIDTGANVSILRTDIAQECGAKLLFTPPSIALKTVTGENIKVNGKVAVNISFGNINYRHTAYVADIPDKMILGLDFLTTYNFIINFKLNLIHAMSEDIIIFHEENKSANQVRATQDITIPSMSEIATTGSIPDNRNGKRNLVAATTLVDVSEGTIPLWIADVSDKAEKKYGFETPPVRQATAAPTTADPWSDLQDRLEAVHHLVRERINTASDKMKRRYDTAATSHQFPEGSKVWLWSHIRRKGLSPKLQSHWSGPFIVIKKINDLVYRIRKSASSKAKVVHYDRLAAYHGT